MKKKKSLSWLLWVIPFLPFFCASIVYLTYYLQAGESVPVALADTFYDSVRIYSLTLTRSGGEMAALTGGITSTPVRILFLILLNFARFGGFIVLGMAVYELFRVYILRLVTWAMGRNTSNYALYGDATSLAALRKQLGRHALPPDNPGLYHARNHIVAFHDYDRALVFLSDHLADLQSDPRNKVWIYTPGDIHAEQLNPHLIINNSARNCARLYWEKNYLKPDERVIVLLGFGRYGEELLTYALQNNVFMTGRAIQYHVFGDGKKYLAQHPQLSQFLSLNGPDGDRDCLTFHTEAWYEAAELLSAADRFILCADTDPANMAALNELRAANGRADRRTDIRLSNPSLLHTLWQLDDDRLQIFGTDEELYTLTQATNSELYAKGRLVHAYYYGMQNGKDPLACLQDEAFQHEWETTSHYNRCSSIAQDGHSAIKVRALLKDETVRLSEETAHKAAERYQQLSTEERIPYLQMEHRRWCRFLWINGWSYAPTRDNTLRHHPLLVPFEDLTWEEVLKDENAFVILKDAGTGLS